MVTLVPRPRSEDMLIVPPLASTFRLAMVSPSPVPIALVEK